MEAGRRQLDTFLPNGQERWGRQDQGDGHDKEGREGGRMMEGPGDGAEWAPRTPKDRKELWTPPAGRESKLEVVRSGSSYDVRAYKGDPKPSRLYQEEEEERYKIPPGDAPPERTEALEDERKELIRKQAVKRSSTVAERRGSPERPSLGQEPPQTGQGGSDRSRREPVAPQNVDRGQICFAAARHQFLALEKAQPRALLGPPRSPGSRGVPWRERVPGPLKQREVLPWDSPHHGGPGGHSERTDQVLQSPPPPVERSPGTAGGDPAWGEQLGGLRGDPLGLPAGGPDPETPVEREIRLSRAREEAHRRERGVSGPDPREEMVAIQARPLLAAAVASWPATSRKGKPLVSFCIQKEAGQETRREETLQREGWLPVGYDRGCRQQLAERRKVFEVETPSLSPGRAADPVGRGSPATGGSGPNGRGSPEAHEPASALLGKEWPLSPRGPAPDPRWMDPPASPKRESPPGALPGSSSGGRDRPDGWEEREMQARPEGVRDERYTLWTWRPRTSALIDREIQEALEREMELQEQRRKVSQGATDARFSSQSSGKRRETAGGRGRNNKESIRPHRHELLHDLQIPVDTENSG